VKSAVKEAMAEVVEEGTEEAMKKAAREAAQAAAKKAAKEASEAAGKKAAKEAAKEGLGKAAQKAAKEAAEEVLDEATEEAIQKAAKEAAQESLAKGAKKGAFAEGWDSFKAGTKKWLGQTPSDEWTDYMKKSTEMQALLKQADMDDAAAAKLAKELGYEKSFAKELAKLDTGIDTAAEKWVKYMDLEELQEAAGGTFRYADEGTEELLDRALKNLDEASTALAKSESDFALKGKALKKFFQKIAWTHGVRQMNWMGSGTEGGVFSTGGLNWAWGPFDANYLHPDSRRWDEKWYNNLNEYYPEFASDLFGDMDWDQIDELGLTREEDAEYWETASATDDGETDYWYEGYGGGETSTDIEVSDDDYWWLEETERDAGIGVT
jgi:hypothetical protein